MKGMCKTPDAKEYSNKLSPSLEGEDASNTLSRTSLWCSVARMHFRYRARFDPGQEIDPTCKTPHSNKDTPCYNCKTCANNVIVFFKKKHLTIHKGNAFTSIVHVPHVLQADFYSGGNTEGTWGQLSIPPRLYLNLGSGAPGSHPQRAGLHQPGTSRDSSILK